MKHPEAIYSLLGESNAKRDGINGAILFLDCCVTSFLRHVSDLLL